MEFPTYLYAPMATLFGVSVSVVLWIKNQRRKELTYELARCDALLNVRGEARRRIDVRFDGQPVEDAHLLVVRLTNTGHVPINPGDYQGRVSIAVGPGSTIVAADVIETVPGDLEERVLCGNGKTSLIAAIEKDRLMLQPVLLNEQDSLSVQMLVRKYSGKVTVSGHVQGINAIKQMTERNILPVIFTQLGAITMAVAMLLCGPQSLLRLQIDAIVPYFLLFLLGYVLLCAGIYLPQRKAYWLSAESP